MKGMTEQDFEQIYEESPEHLREMALMVLSPSNLRRLPNGMRIEVITTEYEGISESPHFHLFPASHIPRKGTANNYDLITRVSLDENILHSPQEIHAILGNNPVPKEYQEAIFEWIFEWLQKNDSKLGVNNWKLTRNFWDRQAASFRYR